MPPTPDYLDNSVSNMNDLPYTVDSHVSPHIKSHSLNTFSTNPRSIVNRLHELQSVVYSKSYDIICLTETWLSDTIYDSEILPYNYTIFCKDRQSHGGSVLVAVDNRIPCHQIDSPEDLEAVCINLTLISPITVCVIYIPPSSPDVHYGNLFTFLSSLQSTSEGLLILGDFNLPDIDWDIFTSHSLVSNQFCDLVFHTNLCQLIFTPTHIHGSILDLLLTNLDDRISNLQIHSDSYSNVFLVHCSP